MDEFQSAWKMRRDSADLNMFHHCQDIVGLGPPRNEGVADCLAVAEPNGWAGEDGLTMSWM